MTPGEEACRNLQVSLYDHFNAIRVEQDKRIEQSRSDSREALSKAEKAQERRLDLLNEFRAQAADESKKYAIRETTDARLHSLDMHISRIYGGMLVIGFIGVANLVKLWMTN